MKNKVSSLIAEGILFCGSGILLLSYSLISYAKAFNKSWSQSPYLFPVLVGADLEPVKGMMVGLHADLSDSAFDKKPFDRVSRTDRDRCPF